MKIRASVLRDAIESLPDPNNERRNRWHILMPREIEILESASTYPNTRIREEELIFTLEAYKEGCRPFYEWCIDIEIPKDVKQEYRANIKKCQEITEYWKRKSEENGMALDISNGLYKKLLNKWYVKFAFSIECWFKSL